MKSKIFILLIAACLFAGCGNTEKTESNNTDTVNVSEKIETEPTIVPTQETVIDEYDEYDEYDEVIHTFRPGDYDSDVAKNISKPELYVIEKEGYKKEENAYREAVLFDEIEIKTVQKSFDAEIEVKDTDMKEIFDEYDKSNAMFDEDYFHNEYIDNYMRYGDSSNPKIQFYIENKVNYIAPYLEEDNISEGELPPYEAVIYKKNIETGAVNKSIVLSGRQWDKESGEEGDFRGTTLTTYEDMVAVVEEQYERKICIVNTKDDTFEIVDFKNLVINEFGLCKANMEYRDDKKNDEVKILDLTFVNENELAVKTAFDHVFIYDIAKSEITDSIKLYGYKWKEFDLKNGMCNLMRKTNGAKVEYFVIDLDNMQIVSHVVTSNEDFESCRFEYMDGVTYFTNDKGLYAYNPGTKGFDVIYEDFKKKAGHTEVTAMFSGDTIYLLRTVCKEDEDKCLEREYKEIALK